MEERHLLYSLIEKVLILYREQMNMNATEKCQEDIFEAGPVAVPWRVIILSMTLWFLTILTWATFTLRVIKSPNRNVKLDTPKSPNARHTCAPNYHTHFHCSCRNKKFMQKCSPKQQTSGGGVLDHQIMENYFETVGTDENFSQSGDPARMEVEVNAEVYEVAI